MRRAAERLLEMKLAPSVDSERRVGVLGVDLGVAPVVASEQRLLNG